MFTIIQALRATDIDAPDKTTSFQIRCPFHKGGAELAPSARVYPDTNSIHCFTCHRSWSPVTLLAEHLDVSYREALTIVRAKYGDPGVTLLLHQRVQEIITEHLRLIAHQPLKARPNTLMSFDNVLLAAAIGQSEADVLAEVESWQDSEKRIRELQKST